MPIHQNLPPSENRARQVLVVATRLLGKTDADLGHALGLSRAAAQQRKGGRTRMKIDDIEKVAEAWDIPAEVFRMDPIDAGSWMLNNRSEQVLSSLPWNTVPATAGANAA